MREKGKRMKQDGICEKALWRLSSTRQWQPFFLVIFLSIFLSLFNLTGDAPLLSCMPSVITFFSYFFPFLSIYLHFLKRKLGRRMPPSGWMPGAVAPPSACHCFIVSINLLHYCFLSVFVFINLLHYCFLSVIKFQFFL